jgi:hypothetical protein
MSINDGSISTRFSQPSPRAQMRLIDSSSRSRCYCLDCGTLLPPLLYVSLPSIVSEARRVLKCICRGLHHTTSQLMTSHSPGDKNINKKEKNVSQLSKSLNLAHTVCTGGWKRFFCKTPVSIELKTFSLVIVLTAE